MEVEKYQPTQIVHRPRAPRELSILPPSFNKTESKEEIEILDGLPYIERFSEMQIANAEKIVQDEMRNMDKIDYLKNDPMPECPIIVK